MDPDLMKRVQALMQEIYEAGLRDGGAAMRDAILKAAEVPVSIRAPAEHRVLPVVARAAPQGVRAPRGLLPQTVARAMTNGGGMTEQEITNAVVALDGRISPRSVGGQLRRFKGELYRQEGRLWFLIAKESAGPEAGPAYL